MAFCFCTVVSFDYLPFALTLADSIQEWVPEADLHVLVSCSPDELASAALPDMPGVHFLSVDDLRRMPMGEEVYQKYDGGDTNPYRWACKPALLSHLLNQEGTAAAIFLDGDILICGDCRPLIREVLGGAVSLVPHWHFEEPLPTSSCVPRWFRFGMLNAGFIGATSAGLSALAWWHRMCMSDCVWDEARRLFYDQKYLDLFPVLFEGVQVLRDRRYNVGGWRLDGFIAGHGGVWPLAPENAPVFLHFTSFEKVTLGGVAEKIIAEYSARLEGNGLPYSLLESVRAEHRSKVTEAEARRHCAASRAVARAAARGARERLRARLDMRVRRWLAIGTRFRHVLEAFRLRPRDL